ncbi:MAG: hypothetical protein PHY59_09710 [Methanobacterium sp.]|nr:hypothetical protein [Methanobacterium sp.]
MVKFSKPENGLAYPIIMIDMIDIAKAGKILSKIVFSLAMCL